MRRDGGRDKPCAAKLTLKLTKDAFASKPGIEPVAGATSVIGPETGSGLKRTPMPDDLANRVLPAPTLGGEPSGRPSASSCRRMGSAKNGVTSVGNDAAGDQWRQPIVFGSGTGWKVERGRQRRRSVQCPYATPSASWPPLSRPSTRLLHKHVSIRFRTTRVRH